VAPRLPTRAFHAARDESGQNLVEFALLLPILLLILMGIMQFGLIFNAYVTLNNAVREGARRASVYVFDTSQSPGANDAARLALLEDAIVGGRGVLNLGPSRATGTANFDHDGSFSGGCSWNAAGPCTVTDGDIRVTYTIPAGVKPNEPRRGYFLQVEAFYHEPLFVPLIDQFLPADPSKGAGWFRVPATMTVVIN
jgi:hypothetical protein